MMRKDTHKQKRSHWSGPVKDYYLGYVGSVRESVYHIPTRQHEMDQVTERTMARSGSRSDGTLAKQRVCSYDSRLF